MRMRKYAEKYYVTSVYYTTYSYCYIVIEKLFESKKRW